MSERCNFSVEQLAVLETSYDEDPRPSVLQREALAAEIGTTPHSVHIWFANRQQRGQRPLIYPGQISEPSAAQLRSRPGQSTDKPDFSIEISKHQVHEIWSVNDFVAVVGQDFTIEVLARYETTSAMAQPVLMRARAVFEDTSPIISCCGGNCTDLQGDVVQKLVEGRAGFSKIRFGHHCVSSYQTDASGQPRRFRVLIEAFDAHTGALILNVGVMSQPIRVVYGSLTRGPEAASAARAQLQMLPSQSHLSAAPPMSRTGSEAVAQRKKRKQSLGHTAKSLSRLDDQVIASDQVLAAIWATARKVAPSPEQGVGVDSPPDPEAGLHSRVVCMAGIECKWCKLTPSGRAAGLSVVQKGDSWTEEEDAEILRLVARVGFKWSNLSELLPGHSASSCRERYNMLSGRFSRAASPLEARWRPAAHRDAAQKLEPTTSKAAVCDTAPRAAPNDAEDKNPAEDAVVERAAAERAAAAKADTASTWDLSWAEILGRG